jgi:pyruvate dehydrogenase E2 component (dihydrolipoamide acetyltransferase)
VIAEFRLPDLGEGLPEAEIVQWMVAPGDTVSLNQTIAEVETAKAIVELPSPYAGVVARLQHEAGDVVAVGEPLIAFELPGDHQADASKGDGGERSTDVDADVRADGPELPNLVGYGAPPRASGRPQRRARASTTSASAAAISESVAVREAAPHDAVTDTAPDLPVAERPRSTPPVRKLAKDLGVDLALVAASGVTGLITRSDVETYVASVGDRPATKRQQPITRAEATDPEPTTSARETLLPIRGVRKATAEAMVRSAFTAPHVTTFLTVDVTATVRLIDDLRADRRFETHRIGILAVVAKATCLALRRHPELNSRWDDAAGVIRQFGYVNLGIAAATDRGLVVPHVRDADRLDLAGLADAIGDLARTAREGRTAIDALRGGTFSLTNFGVFGIDSGTPILNPGEAGILGIGSVRRQPWEHEGQIVLREVMTLSLSFDHRLVDGEQGALFLRAVGDVLREPGRAMLLA